MSSEPGISSPKRPGAILIGTSGWSYGHWKKLFYPEGLPSTQWLSYFSERFPTLELNNSFYKLPSQAAFENWAKQIPEDFVMAVKASRYITHIRQLSEPEEPVQTLLDRAEGLGDKLGPILFQLPPSLKADLGKLDRLLDALPRRYYRFAIEFRNETWFQDDVYQALKDAGVALVIAHSTERPTVPEVTAPFTYLRFHGGGPEYESRYIQEQLEKWAGMLGGFSSRGIDSYAYFNNDHKAFALMNAVELRELLGLGKESELLRPPPMENRPKRGKKAA